MPSLQEVFDQTKQARRDLTDSIAAYYENTDDENTEETETGDQGSSGSDTFTDEELDQLRQLAEAGSEVASQLTEQGLEEEPTQGGSTDAGRRGIRWTEETPGEIFDRLIRRGGDRPRSLSEAFIRKAKRRVAVFDGPIS